ncbi:MAG: DUF192 domain-containing protein [Rhodospirillaceae bacterium]|nr:DUF192 domain-containing protein [Rhodospirillaceae bacterium]
MVIRRCAAFLLGLGVLLQAQPAGAESLTFPLDVIRGAVVVARLQVELAATPESRAIGLMGRDRLAVDAGMLFDYGRPVMSRMWMHQTRIPLDMLFVDADRTIRHVHAMARPFDETVIASPVPVRWVLEVNGGGANALGIQSGDRIFLEQSPRVSLPH